MRIRYYGNNLNKVPPEEIGQPISLRRIAELSGRLYNCNNLGRTKSLIFSKSVNKFIKAENKKRNLSKQLIYSLTVDCLKFELPFTDKEKKARAKFLNKMPKIVGRTRGTTEKSCFRSEFYWHLIYQGSPMAITSKDKQYLQPMAASELLAFWLLTLGISLGSKQLSSTNERNSEFIHSIARCESLYGEKMGSRVARAANSIRHHYQGWNILQAPGQKKGVYQGFEKDFSEGYQKATARIKFSDDPMVVAEHKW